MDNWPLYPEISLFRYLPGDEEKLKRFEMLGAGMLLLYQTENIFNKVSEFVLN